MATIRALEGRTVHQIQSGQVIVDLCSVVKELLENSLDAGATSVEVRFKNNGLDSIEVQDNGFGISSENYETVALKHYTSKLSNYDDLTSLQTFGFRGEALSSLCALSKLHIITAKADEAPKGTRLDFEITGKLKNTSVVASQRGTTVAVEELFLNLPVRRRALEKNIKREYGKVLGLLQSYACISTEARISVSNVMAKGKKAVAFATKSNSTTRENIANVFGTKALPMLVAMNLRFDLQPTSTPSFHADNEQVRILGHVSRPVSGEGRNAPDRQMFFVNARPCGLPQVAKVFNEVYKSYNASQSPFILANIILDTNSYDVNVSPDKRTILLHNQSTLLESLRKSLTDLFEKQDQTMPQMQKAPGLKQVSVQPERSRDDNLAMPTMRPTNLGLERDDADGREDEEYGTDFSARPNQRSSSPTVPSVRATFVSREATELNENPKEKQLRGAESDGYDDPHSIRQTRTAKDKNISSTVGCSNKRIAEQQSTAEKPLSDSSSMEESIQSEEGNVSPASRSSPKPSPGIVPNAFDRMRPRRQSPELTTIMIGSKTTSTLLGGSTFKKRRIHSHFPPSPTTAGSQNYGSTTQQVSQQMQSFAAPGSSVVKTIGSAQSKPRASRPRPDESEEEQETIDDSSSAQSDAKELSDDGDDVFVTEIDHIDKHRVPSVSGAESDDEYIDDNEKKAREDAKVAELIKYAEKTEVAPTLDKKRHAHQVLKGVGNKETTTGTVQLMDTSIEHVDQKLKILESALQAAISSAASTTTPADLRDITMPEESLTLTISKDDFIRMHVIGQFNLGFILATRDGTDLFIIDQHASDEKYNFERLQSTTVVQNQRLVHPRRLELTAVDEEIVLENNGALLKNGFQVEMDQSGSEPVGQRCKLLSLPMSKEVTFDTSDLEELITLLAESPPIISSSHIPRPSKVRRMFAMRACRSSIMIGKTLTRLQMTGVLKHMGEIDKPWNCPHGRPTMRHVCGLNDWSEWKEGDGLGGMEERAGTVDWKNWVKDMKASNSHEKSKDLGDRVGTIELAADDEEVDEEDDEEDDEEEEDDDEEEDEEDDKDVEDNG